MPFPGAVEADRFTTEFELYADIDGAKSVVDRLKTIKPANSLSGVTSLANQPVTNTHAAPSPQARGKADVSENLARLPVGIEAVQTSIDDHNQALNAYSPPLSPVSIRIS
jgi:cystathionine beta-lyase/cystathionine gamma-synthase